MICFSLSKALMVSTWVFSLPNISIFKCINSVIIFWIKIPLPQVWFLNSWCFWPHTWVSYYIFLHASKYPPLIISQSFYNVKTFFLFYYRLYKNRFRFGYISSGRLDYSPFDFPPIRQLSNVSISLFILILF